MESPRTLAATMDRLEAVLQAAVSTVGALQELRDQCPQEQWDAWEEVPAMSYLLSAVIDLEAEITGEA